MTDLDDRINSTLLPLLKHGVMVIALKEALDIAKLAIVPKDELTRAERLGMERAARVAICTQLPNIDRMATACHAHKIAAAIRADMGGG